MKQIEKLSEGHLGKAFDSIKGDIGGTTEQKLKNFSFALFGAPIAEIAELYQITGGIMETAGLTTSIALLIWALRKAMCHFLSFVALCVVSWTSVLVHLKRPIWLIEASQMATDHCKLYLTCSICNILLETMLNHLLNPYHL